MSNSRDKPKFTPNGEDDPNLYPPGWDYEKTRRVAEFFDRGAGGEVVIDPQGPLLDYEPDEVILVEVPAKLVPQVKQLITEDSKKRAS